MSVNFYERIVIQPYQRFVSPHTTGFIRCRFRPTCSNYSAQAVRKRGFPIGIWLTTIRILRCEPWVPMGTPDPVPE
ncbi:MAG: membrane protein insertion efficiency factor YidD [Chthoniobacterales bacterium]